MLHTLLCFHYKCYFCPYRNYVTEKLLRCTFILLSNYVSDRVSHMFACLLNTLLDGLIYISGVNIQHKDLITDTICLFISKLEYNTCLDSLDHLVTDVTSVCGFLLWTNKPDYARHSNTININILDILNIKSCSSVHSI